MGRVFITGDKHGNFSSDEDYQKIKKFCDQFETTTSDMMIVLGDHGIHYDGTWGDHHARKKLAKYPITFVMIRGNHDMRAQTSWHRVFVMKPGTVTGWFREDPENKNILYTDEYGWYTFANRQTFVINGAYSADKFYRLMMQRCGHVNARWFSDEQLNKEERDAAEQMLFSEAKPNAPFLVMSHTCPIRFKPTECFLPQIDQSTVDETMEKWMDELFEKTIRLGLPLTRWYCGHWHTDKTVEPMRFVYHDILELEGPRQ